MHPFQTKTNDALDASKTYFQIKLYRKLYSSKTRKKLRFFIKMAHFFPLKIAYNLNIVTPIRHAEEKKKYAAIRKIKRKREKKNNKKWREIIRWVRATHDN